MSEYITPENIKFAGPVIAAIIALVTAVITFMLTSAFTMYRERQKNHVENRAFFDYGEYEMYFPIENDRLESHGEGILLFGPNGQKFKEESKRGNQYCAFLIIHNRSENDLLNVRIKTIYSGNNKITEEFVLPYWKSEDAIYLFQSDFMGSTHLSTNEELTIEFTTKTFEKLRFSYKRVKKGVYKEIYEKRFLKKIWINMINYKHSDFFTYQMLKIDKNKE